MSCRSRTPRRAISAGQVTAILLLVVGASAEASSTASITSSNPFVWGDYARSFAAFEIAVTNTGVAPDAYEVGDVQKPLGLTAPVGRINAPTPTLPLGPGETGSLVLWLGGFEQPSPPGPAAGDYVFTVQVKSTIDGTSTNVSATIRRVHPAAPGAGTVTGRITDARTGQPLDGRVALGDPTSVMAGDLAAPTPGGFYTIANVPAGIYWLWADAAGHTTRFASEVMVAAGQTTARDLALEPMSVRAGRTMPSATGDAVLPTYRAAYAADLTRIATLPGFYTPQPGDPPRALALFDASGSRLWTQALPADSTVPYDIAEWTSTDGGVALTADGTLVAVGSSGGTVAVYDAVGTLLWQTSRESDVNPRVAGPLGLGLRRSSEVRFSPDATRLAAGSLTGWVYCFDARSGALAWQFATAGQVRALRFSPDGTRVYAGSGDNRLYALAVDSGAKLWEAPLTFWPWEHVAVTADGQRIAVGGKDGVVRVFDAGGNAVWSRTLPGFINGLDLSPDGEHLIVNHGATGVYDFTPDGQIRWYRRDLLGASRVFVGAQGRSWA